MNENYQNFLVRGMVTNMRFIRESPKICPFMADDGNNDWIYCHEGIPSNQKVLPELTEYYLCSAWVEMCGKSECGDFMSCLTSVCEFSKPHCRRLE
jgi:hypothetical protein